MSCFVKRTLLYIGQKQRGETALVFLSRYEKIKANQTRSDSLTNYLFYNTGLRYLYIIVT